MIFNVNSSFDQVTLEKALKSMHVPKKELHWLRMSKDITINNRLARITDVIREGDIVFIPDFETHSNYKPSKEKAEVIYQDEYLAVVHKPEGQKTHPNEDETDTLLNDAMNTFNVSYIEPIHRLDQSTSGLLLLALNPYIKKMLDYDLEERSINRKYIARVEKNISPQMIEARIGKKPHTSNEQHVDYKRGKRAITHILQSEKNLEYGFYELLVKLDTGRTHQVRVHLQHIGAPIIGDLVYGGTKSTRMELYATHVAFRHPITHEYLKFEYLPK